MNTTGGLKGKKGGTKKAEKHTTQTEDILNSILPPRSVSLRVNRAHYLYASDARLQKQCFSVRHLIKLCVYVITFQRMDGRRAIVGPVCVEHSSYSFGYCESAGASRSPIASKTS